MSGPSTGFSESRIRAELGIAGQAHLRDLVLLCEVDSTNLELARRPAAERHACAILADGQSAGRGRRRRAWHSPPGGNLYLSVGWRFEQPPRLVAPLPLVCAVISARILESLEAPQVRIKWPNDLQIDGRKLGGILVESGVSGPSRFDVIAGIGINVRMEADRPEARAIDQPWTCLADHLVAAGEPAFRDRLAGRLLGGLLQGFGDFGETGFGPFQTDWQRFDALRGQEVRVSGDQEALTGRVLGITPQGALRVRIQTPAGGTEVREFLAGDVSVRPHQEN
ncbi:biotin--[acetyl-CoA-carboxylase] ligase [Elongatibacter sediminis]|uniref:biotin--[biotin carboxyl-carrier protein] ligase n=1 Tax=Elongatibacter sediminis TaxID=3119006 RepID=A0AAW9RLN6_9GAMM